MRTPTKSTKPIKPTAARRTPHPPEVSAPAAEATTLRLAGPASATKRARCRNSRVFTEAVIIS